VPRQGTDSLEFVITEHPSSFIRSETLLGISDHSIVFLRFYITPIKKKKTEDPKEDITCYENANWERVTHKKGLEHKNVGIANP
jgi:hypothetical protein